MNMIDGFGIYGAVLHYAAIITIMGCAGLIFCYLWYKGRLDMDEEAKMHMFQEDE